ncbi:hypothetical protein PR048_001942 [Dryococelus australis]|uniref:Uncharacterized protein n=1 Tax=Dryococelus australis TaxID=614101 RepID=A0ABQ9IIS8_9NEOP|nr:hypothetical protein PR048_001942 [Dryococelus australis]
MPQHSYTERGIVVVVTQQPMSSEGWINGHENRGKFYHIDAHRRSSSDVRKESHLELVAGWRLGVSNSFVLTILHDDGLYPYR